MRDFRRDIEGLRAIAVGAVVLFHAGVPGLTGGYVGVDIFFVISGFLITGQLLRDEDDGALTRVRHFYVRRIRRIVPAATVTIVVTLLLALVLVPPLLQRSARADGLAAMFFFANLHFLREAIDYFRQGETPSLFQHFWSLSIEEQFYFVWPGVLVLAGLTGAARRRIAYSVVITVVCVGSLGVSVLMTRDNPATAFYLLPARAWELGAGALLAIYGRPIVSSVGAARALRGAGLALVVTSIATFGDVAYFPGYAALVPVVGTAAVIAAGMAGDVASDNGVLGLAPMQWLGRYSYSVYLWHWPVLILVAARHPAVLREWPLALAVMAGGALPAAVASYHVVEHPVRVRLTGRPDRVALRVGAAILGGGAVFVGGYAAFAMGALDSGRPAPAAVVGALDPTPFVPSNLTPTLLAAHNGGNEAGRSCRVSLNPCVLGDAAATTTIALFGDSHSLHWFAAFDAAGRANHWRVVTLVRPGCPSYDHPPAVKFTRCDGFRRRANEAIAALRPNLVVFSNSSTLALASLGDDMRVGVRRAIERIPTDIPVVVFGQTPTAPEDVPACLSDHLANTRACEPTPTSGAVPRINGLLRSAVDGTHAAFVDAGPLVCAERCPTVIGNTLVYRDDDHVTYEFARTRSGALAALLAPRLA